MSDLLTTLNPLALVLCLPLVGALLIVLCHRRPNLREAVTLATAAALLLAVLRLLGLYVQGAQPTLTLAPMLGGLSLSLNLEPLGMLFLLVASALWVVNSIYSIGYMRANHEQNQTRFYLCFALAIAFTMGLAMSANLLTLFVFYELLTLSTYPLVTHSGTPEARKGGRIYLGILLTSSIGMLMLAIVWTWASTGTLDFRPGGILAGHIGGVQTGLLLMLFMFGTGKAALMPLHRWLPAAMVAPTPVSALLHAVAVVKAGVFTVVKVVVYVFGPTLLQSQGAATWLVWVAGASILLASTIALKQDHLKRRLAYSTISQLSYVTLAAAILAPLSLVGAALHIAAHAFGKITLFFAAGAIHTAAHKDYVSQLNGIGRRMPWTMGAFTIGALSMIGLPPTAGFLSKWFILQGAWQSGLWGVVAVLALSTLLNAGYFLPILYRAFFKAEDAPAAHGHHHPAAHAPVHDHGEAPFPMVLALCLTAAGTLALFLFPDGPLSLAQAMLGGPR
ncbi:proton-conducting transporter transmembrane domain-containing protein [Insolitispirillum peregrinum]|uniref:proton-conducting transporter transmembrane domain-containing protein n=1 Tax=Insolitispirillum peregrinum TaxID=80876 RepID=UPI00360C0463